MLKINDISKNLGNFKLENINLELEEGYIMGVIGPNGSGKTTLIKMIMGLMQPDKGEIKVFDKSMDENEIDIKNNIGFVYDSLDFYPNLKVKDFKKVASLFYKNYDENMFENYISEFNINLNTKIKNLSKGESVKLMLANALSHNAKLLILDEPTAGLDPIVRREILKYLQAFIEGGDTSVIISTHNTEELDKIADYITFINKGEQVFTLDKESLMDEYKIVRCIKEDLERIQTYIVGTNENKYYIEALVKITDEKIKEELKSFDTDNISNPSVEDMMLYYVKGSI